MTLFTPFSPAVKLEPFLLGPSIRSRSDLTYIFKLPCRCTGRISRICGRSLGYTTIRVSRALLVIGTFLFQGCGQNNRKLVVICTLLVPLAGRLVVSVQVNHVVDEGTSVEI